MAENNTRRRSRSRRRRRRSNQISQQQQRSVTIAAAQLPKAPEEEWDQKSVKTFATKRKKKDLHLSTYLPLPLPDLQDLAEKVGMEDALGLQRGPILRRLIHAAMESAGVFFTKGSLEILPEGHGFLRHTVNDYTPNLDTDALLHKELIEK